MMNSKLVKLCSLGLVSLGLLSIGSTASASSVKSNQAINSRTQLEIKDAIKAGIENFVDAQKVSKNQPHVNSVKAVSVHKHAKRAKLPKRILRKIQSIEGTDEHTKIIYQYYADSWSHRTKKQRRYIKRQLNKIKRSNQPDEIKVINIFDMFANKADRI